MIVSAMMDSYGEEFCFMEKVRVPDGEGGFNTRWRDGAKLTMIVKHDSTIIAQQAEAQNEASTYTFLVDKGTPLSFPDVVKRLSDSQTFQISSDAGDKKTPDTSALDLALVTAKKWRLPE